MAAGPLSVVALIAGWITTEVGRQPWIVYGVMRTSQAVTAADDLEVGYAFLVAVYLSLAVAVVILWSSIGLFKESVWMSLAGVPSGIDADAVGVELAELDGFAHDLHSYFSK